MRNCCRRLCERWPPHLRATLSCLDSELCTAAHRSAASISRPFFQAFYSGFRRLRRFCTSVVLGYRWRRGCLSLCQQPLFRCPTAT